MLYSILFFIFFLPILFLLNIPNLPPHYSSQPFPFGRFCNNLECFLKIYLTEKAKQGNEGESKLVGNLTRRIHTYIFSTLSSTYIYELNRQLKQQLAPKQPAQSSIQSILFIHIYIYIYASRVHIQSFTGQQRVLQCNLIYIPAPHASVQQQTAHSRHSPKTNEELMRRLRLAPITVSVAFTFTVNTARQLVPARLVPHGRAKLRSLDSTGAMQMQASSPCPSSQPFEIGLSLRGVTTPSSPNSSTSSTSLGHHSDAAEAYKPFVCQVSPPTPLSDFMHESQPISVLGYPNMFVPDYNVDGASAFDSLQFSNVDTPVTVSTASLSMSPPLGNIPSRPSSVSDSFGIYDQPQHHHQQHPSSTMQFSRDQWNMALPIPRSNVYPDQQKLSRAMPDHCPGSNRQSMSSAHGYSDLSKPLDMHLQNLDGSIPTSQAQYGLSATSYPHSPSPTALSEADLRSKPQCWDHGCNGRSFSTFSNLLRHQREKAGLSVKAECPYCGAAFTRSTARNGHLERGRCKAMREE
ncbi:uncharacterized protein ARB_05017 [Trichophyton benhamiae CBS 112371]|uniref:C2H2-type domain-containing protein n=1 Tax=Arthroderma benhamiae (strain ATCC MYA-4681 / CBS 112371) TaxID=663331 RepID=D4AL21_ARTBC|nr:uncharacterized protein ARB_05017 [Trichophyton benhamiae CBS 112371]EFE36080.1 hypothetical protein ARB_05017 [Trichophyton benhamiae CBS 112371]